MVLLRFGVTAVLAAFSLLGPTLASPLFRRDQCPVRSTSTTSAPTLPSTTPATIGATSSTTPAPQSTIPTTSATPTTSVTPTTSITPTTSATPTTSTPTATTSPGSGQCSGVSAWVNNVVYVSGDKVTYNGDLWVANQWNDDEVPGGLSGAWDDNGAC